MVSPTPDKNQDLGFLRVSHITNLLSISRSTWWLWVQKGKAPKGRKLSKGITVWARSDIYAFIEKLEAETADTTPPEAA